VQGFEKSASGESEKRADALVLLLMSVYLEYRQPTPAHGCQLIRARCRAREPSVVVNNRVELTFLLPAAGFAVLRGDPSTLPPSISDGNDSLLLTPLLYCDNNNILETGVTMLTRINGREGEEASAPSRGKVGRGKRVLLTARSGWHEISGDTLGQRGENAEGTAWGTRVAVG